MRLEDSFYKTVSISRTGEDSFEASIELMPGHPVYEGHFPEKAIVPGVCTLTIIRECAGKILHREVSFAAIKECKFLSALTPAPGLKVRLCLAFTEGMQIRASVWREDNMQAVLKLKGILV